MSSVNGPVKFLVDPFHVRLAAVALFSSISAIEATHLTRIGRPISFVYGQVMLAPIIRDIAKLALSCTHTAGNYESCEAALTPTMMKDVLAIQPGLAKALATFGLSMETLLGQGETPVTTKLQLTQPAAAATTLPALLERLAQAGSKSQIMLEITEGEPGGPRHFTIYLPGTANWSPITGDSPFDLTSDLTAMAGPGVSAPERAALQVLTSADFGRQSGDRLTIVGYSEGGLAGANLISSGAVTALGGSVAGLVSVASPMSAVRLPSETKVLALEHSNDPVPQLDLAERTETANWSTVKLPPASGIGHSMTGYQASVRNLAADLSGYLNHKFASLFGTGTATVAAYSAVRT